MVKSTELSACMLRVAASTSASSSSSSESLNTKCVCLSHNKTTAGIQDNSGLKSRFSASDLNYCNCSENDVSSCPSHNNNHHRRHYYRQREAYQACAVAAACFHIYTDTPLSGNSKLQIFPNGTALYRKPAHRQYSTKSYVSSSND